MTLPRFLQIHTLHNYPGALLNRDDAGLAKRLPYGDAVRTRISSQCLKRHLRVADDAFALRHIGVPMAVRSRQILDLVRQELADRGADADMALAAAEALRAAGLLDKAKEGREGAAALETGQAVLLGRAEIDYLVECCGMLIRDQPKDAKAVKAAVAAWIKEEKKNIDALRHGCGLESALFGRMVTSDVLSNRDASVYVAHAFPVHEAQVENDYFTVVDDLLRDAGEAGSAGIFDTELTSGLYYGYVVVDVPQLVANLEGVPAAGWANEPAERRALAAKVVRHLLHLIATVSPGAKRGSTAPFEWARFMLVEAGDWQPRTLAGAFQNAVRSTTPALRRAAVERLADEAGRSDVAFGAPMARRYLSVDDVAFPGAERVGLAALGQWAAAAVERADAGPVTAGSEV